MDIEEFRQYLRIDKRALDDELVRQPELYFAVSEACAEAVAERDARKEEMAVVDSQLDASLRAKSNGKATEPRLKHEIQRDKNHNKAFKAYLRAKERADKLSALKDSFNQRAYMLRELAALFLSNYYGTTVVRGNASTSDASYRQRREKLAEARVKREAETEQ